MSAEPCLRRALARTTLWERAPDSAPLLQVLTQPPAKVTVKAGQSVRWKNDDSRDHKVVAKDGGWKSENLKNGDAYTHTFAKAGTNEYACEYRPRMKGTVVVE